MKKLFVVSAAIALLAIGGMAQATQYQQGFEGSGYDFYAESGSSAGISTSVFHSGSQSAQFTLGDARFAYTRWKSGNISANGLTVNDVIASSWEMRTQGRSDLAPYFLFTIATPDLSKETLAIQFLMPTIGDNVWTQNIVDRTTTTFHVVGDRTGLGTEFSASTGLQGTLNALADKTYSGVTKWGNFQVTYVRIGVGSWDAAQTYNAYVDDVTVGSPSAVPEPATLLGFGLPMLMVGLGKIRGLRK